VPSHARDQPSNSKWFGSLALLTAVVIGDQIRINRPDPIDSPEDAASGSRN
jgi:hypothetical protein